MVNANGVKGKTMRLINADALKQTLKEDYVFYGFSELLDDFYKAIDDAPTIEPKQEWIPCKDCPLGRKDRNGKED